MNWNEEKIDRAGGRIEKQSVVLGETEIERGTKTVEEKEEKK